MAGFRAGLGGNRLSDGSLHPMDLKRVVAGEVTAALHGVDAAMKAREDFDAHFSRRSFADVEDLPTVSDLSRPVVEVVKSLGFASSNSEVRRVAEQKGLRLVVEAGDGAGQGRSRWGQTISGSPFRRCWTGSSPGKPVATT